jgi:KDO2-lipid IV(A) lauroyltransferase
LRSDRAEGWGWRRRLKNNLLYGAAALAVGTSRLLPYSWLAALGRLAGAFAHRWFGRARRIAEGNVELVYPELPGARRQDLVRANFRTLGENLADTLALLDRRETPARSLGVPPSSLRVLEEALRGGRGVIYITAHLGPWERMAALLASLGFPITTLARESYDPRFHALLYDRIRTSRNVEAIYRGSARTPYAIVRSLARGRVVGFPVDLPGRIPTERVELLGQPSRLPIGPARIALRTRSPIVVGTPAPSATSARGSLEVRITRLTADDLEPTAAGELALLQRIAQALTERISALPTHWPWMHPSFAPDREPPIAHATEEPIHSRRGETLA